MERTMRLLHRVAEKGKMEARGLVLTHAGHWLDILDRAQGIVIAIPCSQCRGPAPEING